VYATAFNLEHSFGPVMTVVVHYDFLCVDERIQHLTCLQKNSCMAMNEALVDMPREFLVF